MDKTMIDKTDVKVLYNDSCEATDYLIAVACGAVSGLVDIFLVGSPGNSPLGIWTDSQVDAAVRSFAKMNGWSPRADKENNVASAIGWLETHFKVNYDQRHTADVGGVFDMNTKNHHIKSLAHAPDIVGLFFSILNQFTSTATFISNGQLVTLKTETFELQGSTFIAKLYCGFFNWLGHVMSDIAGSSGSRGKGGRGAGISIPFYELFQFCSFGKFDIGKDRQDLATLAIRTFQEGYDARFGITMAIPVLLCNLSIRLIWAIKRYFVKKCNLNECIPTDRHSDLRVMLLFGNGTLCLMDGADALIRSGGNWLTFFTRLNIVAWTRFISLVLKEICIKAGIGLPLQEQLDSYRRINVSLHTYLQQLQEIDIATFQKESELYIKISNIIAQVESERQLNVVLRAEMIQAGISLPWNSAFDEFMGNRESYLLFE